MQVIFNTIFLWPTLTWAASVSNTVSDKTISTSAHTDGVTEYYTAFLNISYFDKNRGVYHTEKTETGRYSTNVPKDFYGTVVPLVSNFSVDQTENKSTRTIQSLHLKFYIALQKMLGNNSKPC